MLKSDAQIHKNMSVEFKCAKQVGAFYFYSYEKYSILGKPGCMNLNSRFTYQILVNDPDRFHHQSSFCPLY